MCSAKTFVDEEENELIESVNICIRSIAVQSKEAFTSQASAALELMIDLMKEEDEGNEHRTNIANNTNNGGRAHGGIART